MTHLSCGCGARFFRVLRHPPVGVGIVCLIVGATSGHWLTLALFWSSYVVGYLTGRMQP